MATRDVTQVLRARVGVFTQLAALCFALLYQIPNWPELFESIYGYPMRDRTVYEMSLLYFDLPVDYIYSFDPLSTFTRELLWNSSLAYLHRNLGFTTDQIFFVISTFVIWRFCVEIVGRAGWPYVLLLINPLVVDFAFSQLRLACAIAVLSFFWRGQRGLVATVLAYVACTSIHTAVILFALIHLAANTLNKTTVSNAVWLVAIGFALSFAIGPMREVILGAVGDRRADYQDMSSTPIYLLFWVLMLGLLLASFKNSLQSVDTRYTIVILSIVSLNLFTGGYSTRFIAAAFPSLIISMGEYPSKPANIVMLIFIPYAIMQWAYWLRIGV